MKESQVDKIYKVTDTGIHGSFKEHDFMSNFYVHSVIHEGLMYNSSEAAYQAAKTFDMTERIRFGKMSASESKREGRLLKLREDWDKVKLNIMLEILREKFYFRKLGDKLLVTGDKYLEETNWWGDQYWGVCNGIGQNMLGKTLMVVREEIKLSR